MILFLMYGFWIVLILLSVLGIEGKPFIFVLSLAIAGVLTPFAMSSKKLSKHFRSENLFTLVSFLITWLIVVVVGNIIVFLIPYLSLDAMIWIALAAFYGIIFIRDK